MAPKKNPRPTAAPAPAARRMRRLADVAAAALLLGACTPEAVEPARPPESNGSRLPLHAGEWQGAMGGTMIDFRIDRVSPNAVDVRISGNVIGPTRGLDKTQTYFYDRPKVCSTWPARRSFDCPHYTDMHIDNGLLCGTYTLDKLAYHPCFQPVQ